MTSAPSAHFLPHEELQPCSSSPAWSRVAVVSPGLWDRAHPCRDSSLVVSPMGSKCPRSLGKGLLPNSALP